MSDTDQGQAAITHRTDEERDAILSGLGDRIADVLVAIMGGAQTASVRIRGRAGGHDVDVSATIEISPTTTAAATGAQDEHGPATP